MLKRINAQVLVTHHSRVGVTQPDLPGMICTTATQTPVLFEGTTYLEPITSSELRVVRPLDPDRYH